MRLRRHFDRPYLSTSLREVWSRRWNMTASQLLREVVYDPVLAALEGRSLDRAEGSRSSAAGSAPAAQQKAQTASVAPAGGEPGSAAAAKAAKAARSPAVAASAAATAPIQPKGAAPAADATAPATDKPVVQAVETAAPAAPRRPSRGHMLTAQLAAFAASGLAHEMIVAYSNRVVTGEWGAFFLLQWVLSTGEALLDKALMRRVAAADAAAAAAAARVAGAAAGKPQAPRAAEDALTAVCRLLLNPWLRRLTTILLGWWSSHIVLWQPVSRYGLDRRVISNFSFGGSAVPKPLPVGVLT